MSDGFWNPDRMTAVRNLAREPLRIRIAGNCMAPLLMDGSWVWVQSARLYWPGDVLVIRSPRGCWLAHRLIGGYPKGRAWRWLTQADGAERPDNAVSRQAILGRIIGGECAADLASVPLGHRLWALGRFIRFAASKASPRRGQR